MMAFMFRAMIVALFVEGMLHAIDGNVFAVVKNGVYMLLCCWAAWDATERGM